MTERMNSWERPILPSTACRKLAAHSPPSVWKDTSTTTSFTRNFTKLYLHIHQRRQPSITALHIWPRLK